MAHDNTVHPCHAKTAPVQPAAPLDLDRLRRQLAEAQGPRYWRSLEELAATDGFQE
ncbi:MAG: TAT-variant-translocated molybdopterin oxidoreductase, partial [Terriglobales bacterium]